MTTLRTTFGLKKDHPFPVRSPFRAQSSILVQYFLLFLVTFSKEKQKNDIVYAKLLRFKIAGDPAVQSFASYIK